MVLCILGYKMHGMTLAVGFIFAFFHACAPVTCCLSTALTERAMHFIHQNIKEGMLWQS
jgi:hypothetical protein